MKLTIIFITIFVFGLNESFANKATEKPRLSITKFTDKSASSDSVGENCRNNSWYGWTLGDAFREMLTNELSKANKVEILEREVIRDIYEDEFELPNADKRTIANRDKFKTAQYAVAGSVSEFEMCSNGVGAAAGIGTLLGIDGLDVDARRSTATVRIDLRLINVETGVVMKTFSTKGSASSVKLGFEAIVKNVPFGASGVMNTPIGEATREAIDKAAKEILSSLNSDS